MAGAGEASIILNEVNSRDPSKLNGYIEVAGRKAQVVIANSAGITCEGCGFINANRVTLTTGQAQLNNGQLTGYDVDRGHCYSGYRHGQQPSGSYRPDRPLRQSECRSGPTN